MRNFVLRRLTFSIFLVFLSSIVVFFGMRAAPGDVTTQLVNPANSYSAYLVPNLQHILGLHKPLLDQYFSFMGNTLTGHPGIPLINRDPIPRTVGSPGLQTLKLGAAAFRLTLCTALPTALLAGCGLTSVA